MLRTDIQDFFGHVNIDDALAQLPAALNEPAFLELLHLIGRPRRSTGNRRVRTRGIPQGSSLSPLIANLALTDVDNAMCDAGYGYVRFADDIVVCGESPARVAEARARLSAILNQRGFTLSEEKTAVTTFDDGFCYLGANFNGRSPRTDPHHGIKGSPDPDSVVYVGRDGTRVHLSKGRLVVDSESGIPQMSIPQRAITRIVLTGNVGLSAGARSWALYNDIDVVCLSRHGHCLGQLAGPKTAANAARLLAQASFSSDREKRLPLAKAIITAKVRNQVHVLNRIARRAPSLALQDITARMRSWKGDVAHAGTVDEVMGLEGAASSAYFDALALCVPEDIEFNGRSRRPPSRPAQCRIVLPLRGPAQRMRGGALLRGTGTLAGRSPRLDRQAAEPGTGSHGGVPAPAGRSDGYGAATNASPARRARDLGARGERGLVEQGREEDRRRRLRGDRATECQGGAARIRGHMAAPHPSRGPVAGPRDPGGRLPVDGSRMAVNHDLRRRL